MKTTLLITRDRILYNKLSREKIKGIQLSYTDSLDSAEGLFGIRPISALIIDSDTIPFESLLFFRKCLTDMPEVSTILLHSKKLHAGLLSELQELKVRTHLKPATLADILTAPTPENKTDDLLPDAPASEEEILLELMGGSQSMEKIARLVMKVAPSSATILLGGENGTGKEYFATIIHKLSKLTGNFVPVNCGAIPESLFESELFGHKKGSFTGADRDRTGLAEEADGGTLFLDEVGELTLPMQVKLLRFLQEEKFKPVGDTIEKSSRARIIAATNRDLKKMVNEGSFREDLFYRLHVFPLTLPPLRERKEMIPRLIELFLHSQSEKQKKKFKGFTQEAAFILSRHRYPGNIRELQNIVEYASILATKPTLTVDDLPEYLQQLPGITDQRPISLGIDYKPDPENETYETTSLESNFFLVEEIISLQELEERYMRYILEKCDMNHSEAAKILGVSRSTLWRKLKEE